LYHFNHHGCVWNVCLSVCLAIYLSIIAGNIRIVSRKYNKGVNLFFSLADLLQKIKSLKPNHTNALTENNVTWLQSTNHNQNTWSAQLCWPSIASIKHHKGVWGHCKGALEHCKHLWDTNKWQQRVVLYDSTQFWLTAVSRADWQSVNWLGAGSRCDVLLCLTLFSVSNSTCN